MVTLHLCLAVLALLTVPVTLYLFSLALGFQIEAGVPAVAKVVGLTVLVPVGIGIFVTFVLASNSPTRSDRLCPRLLKSCFLLLVFSCWR